MIRWVCFLAVVVTAAAASGCANGPGGHNQLTLQGIKSVTVKVAVNPLSDVDAEDLGSKIQGQLAAMIDQDSRWGKNKTPQADAEVQVIEANLDWPLRLKYIVRAHDAKTGADLGTASGTIQIGAPAAVAMLVGGQNALQSQKAMQSLGGMTLQQMAIGQLVINIQEQLAIARRHPPIDRREQQPIIPTNPPPGYDSKIAAR